VLLAGGAEQALAPVRVQVLPTVDPQSLTQAVRADLPPGTRAVPGQFARLQLSGGAGACRPRVLIPASAVVRRAELTAVYVMGEGQRRSCARCAWAGAGRRSRCWPAWTRAIPDHRSAGRHARRGQRKPLMHGQDTSRRALGISGRIAASFQARRSRRCWRWWRCCWACSPCWSRRARRPQIDVTMANVIVPFPAASARDVEAMVARPAEQVLSQIGRGARDERRAPAWR
jgi:hypothetical protein